jgi:hypothetical protein
MPIELIEIDPKQHLKSTSNIAKMNSASRHIGVIAIGWVSLLTGVRENTWSPSPSFDHTIFKSIDIGVRITMI